MLSLAIDTSTPSGSVAVLQEERVLGMLGIAAEETYSSRLFREVRYLLAELRLSLERFELFSVAAGPGSFTGLRIGLAAAKGWAETFSKPAVGVSVLEAIAAEAAIPAPVLISLLDARRGQVFGAAFERDGSRLARRGEEWVLTPEEALRQIGEVATDGSIALVSPTPEAIQTALDRSPLCHTPVERVSPFLANVIGRLGYRRAICGEASDAIGLDANYVRRSDAELKWRE
jgi:tRNA threonylcarbamoyladenosine biosynthesis protein TsaB